MLRMRGKAVFISGLLSPLAAVVFYVLVSSTLSRSSVDLDKDWLFRLAWATLAMTAPFLVTLALAINNRHRQTLSRSAKVGLAIAVLSLGLAWKPVSDGITRSKQSRNMALRDVVAPPFDTVDILGKTQRLGDHKGEVVLVNIWATWCEPCQNEMPRLDRLYQQRKPQGFIVFGLSDESVNAQRRFWEKVPVSYPFLTLKGEVPSLYREIVRYPAIFLIDRQGRLQPAPGPDQPFEKLESAVDALLYSGSH